MYVITCRKASGCNQSVRTVCNQCEALYVISPNGLYVIKLPRGHTSACALDYMPLRGLHTTRKRVDYIPSLAAWIKNQAATGCLIFCGNTSNWIAGRKTASFRGWCCMKRIAFFFLQIQFAVIDFFHAKAESLTVGIKNYIRII